MAGIRVSNCDDAQPLLRILGYRARPNCGELGTSLQTAEPERAFITIDSGFPLLELEQTLQGGKPFDYPYASSPVPVLFAPGDWTMASNKNYKETSKDLVGTILSDPAVARLYWALSKLDSETNNSLLRLIGIRKLLPYAGVLDFYGSHLCIREGRVIVPGGPGAESAWKDLVGASPASPAAFIQKLLATDRGWLAAYFDVLSRVRSDQQVYFTEPRRLRIFYEAVRSSDPSSSATRGIFRPAPGDCCFWPPGCNGSPTENPSSREISTVWKEISSDQTRTCYESGALAPTSPDQLVQTMFALSRTKNDDGPLQIYLAITELESRRSPEHRLAPATVRLLARKFEEFSDQYRIFSEFPELNDASIVLFLDAAEALNNVPNPVRGNALGTFQANIGIWQILARQGQISNSQFNDSWQQVIRPFAGIRSAAQLYNAGKTSLAELFQFAAGKSKVSQDEIIELLAGLCRPPRKE